MTGSALDVAVVIPARDALPDVLDAVGSALAQSHPAREVIVVDDGSTDGTGDAVARRFGDAVRVLRGRFGSAAAARNAGWRAAGTAWVAFLDADDLWSPGKLAAAAETLAATPEASWFFSDGTFRDEAGVMHDSWLDAFTEFSDPYVGQPVRELFEVNFVLTSSVVVRREALVEVGGFDEGMTHAEDLDLWIRLARRGPAAASGDALVRYQHLPTGLTRQTERRLGGDIALFERLAADPGLDDALRRRARHRSASARYKLALDALRQGRGAEARAGFRAAGWDARLAAPIVAGWLVSLLPAAWIARLRRQHWATRSVGRRLVVARRVPLRGDSRGRA